MHWAVGIDFFVVPTATFRLLYVFVVLAAPEARAGQPEQAGTLMERMAITAIVC